MAAEVMHVEGHRLRMMRCLAGSKECLLVQGSDWPEPGADKQGAKGPRRHGLCAPAHLAAPLL